ncbi:uncharacterized protein LOC131479013 [Ochotona princeps]|uniref:uncharacterized protein LOC131479013 n=1 Tax=Ochotona princeps TaxID=9978 RepID=UPI00271481F3|nr:uncharacterized protein LOC131479013 [Ochotona princeps]
MTQYLIAIAAAALCASPYRWYRVLQQRLPLLLLSLCVATGAGAAVASLGCCCCCCDSYRCCWCVPFELLLRQQDYQLQELSQSAERLHETACTINRELEDQQRMLDELDENLDQQAAQMNFLLRRMGRVLKTNNVRQLCLILWLSGLALLLFLLLIIT